VSIDSDGEKEKTEMKLLCDSKLGRFESVNNKSGEIYRRVFIYNTNLDINQRFEEYRRENTSNGNSISATKVQKDGSNFWVRDLYMTNDTGNISANINEVHYSSSKYFSYGVNLSDTSANFMNDHSPVTVGPNLDLFNSVRDTSSFGDLSTAANNCMDGNNTDVEGPQVACPSFTAGAISLSLSIPLSAAELFHANDANHPLKVGGPVFSITAP
jgi:hypothetical protein